MRTNPSLGLALAAATSALTAWSACGDDGGTTTTSGVSTERPDGDATGTAASGFYTFETLTTACAGTCRVALGDVAINVCDVGARVDATALVTQADGHLQVDSDDSDYISRLEGGLFADGRFDVGGLRTQGGTAFTSRIQATGTITGADALGARMAGTVRGQVTGSLEGRALNCLITGELSGERTALEAPPGD